MRVSRGWRPFLLQTLGSLLLAASTAPPCVAQVALPNAPQAKATLGGQVTDRDGTPIQGAKVLLTPDESTVTTLLTTGDDGSFVTSTLSPGPWHLTVTLSGFVPSTQAFTLVAGQPLTLAPIALSLDKVAITVDAVLPEQIAAIEVHEEEQQRLLGVLPNFFVSYRWQAYPLTARQKFSLASKTAFDPGNLALVGLVSGVQQATNTFPGYHQGAAGYSKRFGADLANLVVGTYLGGAVLPSLFHQDPRYFYKGTGTLRARFVYSISRAVITRGDNGHTQPNFSGVLGDLSAAAISNLYYPASDRQGARVFAINGVLAIAGDAMNGFVQEFILPRFTTKKPKPNTPVTP